jgi:hypothetical protein
VCAAFFLQAPRLNIFYVRGDAASSTAFDKLESLAPLLARAVSGGTPQPCTREKSLTQAGNGVCPVTGRLPSLNSAPLTVQIKQRLFRRQKPCPIPYCNWWVLAGYTYEWPSAFFSPRGFWLAETVYNRPEQQHLACQSCTSPTLKTKLSRTSNFILFLSLSLSLSLTFSHSLFLLLLHSVLFTHTLPLRIQPVFKA